MSPSPQSFYAYIRVSTVRQGEHGVSLQEQKSAIEVFADRNGLQITEWFEERETAAKKGRPVFLRMLKLLRNKKAHGVVIHKIDRSARNLKDWSDLGELVDSGLEIRFAVDDFDMRSRGGRLSADLQAVISADYIRNLRLEVLKGFYGRLKQGYLPLPAPLGYLDKGAATPKAIDPKSGPLVLKAFQMYSTGRFTLDTLVNKLDALGLKPHRGNKLTKSTLSRILKNPFYIGLIRLIKTDEVFQGNHIPLISKSLFDEVQDVLSGKTKLKKVKRDFLLRRLVRCRLCENILHGEIQKGNVYYRCHTKSCTTKCIREDHIVNEIRQLLDKLQFTQSEIQYFLQRLAILKGELTERHNKETDSLKLTEKNLTSRLNQLTDAYLDQIVDKESYLNRKEHLLKERAAITEQILSRKETAHPFDNIKEFFELRNTALLSFESGNLEEKREILKTVFSNFWVSGKNLELEPSNRVFDGKFSRSFHRVDRSETLFELLQDMERFGKARKCDE